MLGLGDTGRDRRAFERVGLPGSWLWGPSHGLGASLWLCFSLASLPVCVPSLVLPLGLAVLAGAKDSKVGGKAGAPHPCTHLIDAEADCVHVLAHLPLAPPVLLDKAHQEGAAVLPVLLVLVLLFQLDQVLRVHPERVCSQRGAGLSPLGPRGPARRQRGSALVSRVERGRTGRLWGRGPEARRVGLGGGESPPVSLSHRDLNEKRVQFSFTCPQAGLSWRSFCHLEQSG